MKNDIRELVGGCGSSSDEIHAEAVADLAPSSGSSKDARESATTVGVAGEGSPMMVDRNRDRSDKLDPFAQLTSARASLFNLFEAEDIHSPKTNSTTTNSTTTNSTTTQSPKTDSSSSSIRCSRLSRMELFLSVQMMRVQLGKRRFSPTDRLSGLRALAY